MRQNKIQYVNRTKLQWREIERAIPEAINCEHIRFSVDRDFEDLYVHFMVNDVSKIEEIKKSIKNVVTKEKYETISRRLDKIETTGDTDMDINIDKETYLVLLEKYYKMVYEEDIKVVDVKAHYDGVGILFEFKDTEKRYENVG